MSKFVKKLLDLQYKDYNIPSPHQAIPYAPGWRLPARRSLGEGGLWGKTGALGEYMKNYVWTLVKKIIGIILIVGGTLGLFLPFFQGIAMIIAGAILLENEFILRKFRQLVAYLKKKKRRH